MGRPKLLLPWGSGTMIEAVLAAWRGARAAAVVVVVHPADEALADICRRAGATVVVPPDPPPDMKASVRYGLCEVARRFAPEAGDYWLLAPADMPWLTPAVVERLAEAAAERPGAIVSPVHAGRRGHPVLFPWPLAEEVQYLGEREGVGALLARHPVVEVPWADDTVLRDLDTPEDYAAGRPDCG